MRRRFSLFVLALLLLPSLSPGLTVSDELSRKIREAARHAFLDPRLVEAVVRVESGFKTHATSPKGAMGLMQVMPETAEECNIPNAYHAVSNLMGACDCLRKLINRYQGNLSLALAAYNAGPRHVDRFNAVPPFPETRDYVRRVLALYRQLKSNH